MNNFAVIDRRMSQKCRKSLENMGFLLIDVAGNGYLDEPVSAHPDIQMFHFNEEVFAETALAQKLKEQMFLMGEREYEISGLELFTQNIRYPQDCVLNFAVCGNRVIGNSRNMHKDLLSMLDKYSIQIINVNQGYAKCNICVVNENAIITEDKGIAKSCTSAGINVLLLERNSVMLNGYKNGFIGGASGTVFKDNKNTVMFCGDITMHPEYSKIAEFICNNGAEFVSLSDEPLYDYGSIFIL